MQFCEMISMPCVFMQNYNVLTYIIFEIHNYTVKQVKQILSLTFTDEKRETGKLSDTLIMMWLQWNPD